MKMNWVSFPLFLTYFDNESLEYLCLNLEYDGIFQSPILNILRVYLTT